MLNTRSVPAWKYGYRCSERYGLTILYLSLSPNSRLQTDYMVIKLSMYLAGPIDDDIN
jgi:hypothetical protein